MHVGTDESETTKQIFYNIFIGSVQEIEHLPAVTGPF